MLPQIFISSGPLDKGLIPLIIHNGYDFLDEITEIRTSCGFRENMIQEANRPFDGVDFKWPICSILESLIQECIKF